MLLVFHCKVFIHGEALCIGPIIKIAGIKSVEGATMHESAQENAAAPLISQFYLYVFQSSRVRPIMS